MPTKDSGMRLRVEKELRDAFVQACHDQNRIAAEVLREFMRTFIHTQQHGQRSLFTAHQEPSK